MSHAILGTPAAEVRKLQNLVDDGRRLRAQLRRVARALDKADLWYRRVCAISVDPDAGILPEHQANDLGNRAVCLRKMDKLRESLELYDRVLAIPEADRAHLAPNRQTCLREMVEWTGTNREYADVRDFRA